MRLVWYGNPPMVASGYGQQAKLLLPRLADMGHEVVCIANYGLDSCAIDWGGITILPRGAGKQDMDLFRYQIDQIKPDIVITFIDAWTDTARQFTSRKMANVRWCPWFPIDREPFPALTLANVRKAYAPIAMSQFGMRECDREEVDAAYVPCAVDPAEMYPTDMIAAREELDFPVDKYIIGLVGANIGPYQRKAIAHQLDAFARFIEDVPDAMIYLHTVLDDRFGGPPLYPLIQQLGIEDHVIIPDQGTMMLGYPRDHLRRVYNAVNVVTHVSRDEGFGVCMIEAQACGTPVISGEWCSMGELNAMGWTLSREDAIREWSHIGGFRYTPNPAAIHRAYQYAYERRKDEGNEHTCVDFTAEYHLDRVVNECWAHVLSAIEERINETEGVENHGYSCTA